VLTVIGTIMTITGRYICIANNYFENNGEVYVQWWHLLRQYRGGICVVLTIMVTITGRYMCSVISYCDNNGEVYM